MKPKKNKLFVWEDVMCDYTCGTAFALAPDVETARKMVIDDGASETEIKNVDPDVIETSQPYAHHVWGGS